MKIITDTKEANILLQLYVGATLQVTMYSTSLRRMALKLMLPGAEMVLYIIGIGCESLNGRFNVNNSNLNITVERSRDNDEPITLIVDKSAAFSLITSGGFSLVQGTESEFGMSFDDFLIEKPKSNF